MSEYPKMLYLGESQENYTTTIVENEDEEKTKLSEGFVDFYDLGKTAVKKTKKTGVENGNNELLDTANSDSELAAPQ